MRGRGFFLIVTCVLVLASGCNRLQAVSDDLKELQLVRIELTKELGTPNVGVNLRTFNGQRSLVISLVNSPLKDLPVHDKRAKAREIAQTAFGVLPSRSKLASLSVSFVTQKGLLGFNYTDARDHITFKPSELTPPSLESPEGPSYTRGVELSREASDAGMSESVK